MQGDDNFYGQQTFINGLKTDTVDEKTPAAGVTIDGCLIKDGNVDGVDVSAHAAAEPFDAHLNNPACRVYHNANQSIANGVSTILAFNSERFDTDAIHNTVSNNSRLTCKTAGLYVISVTLLFATNAVGIRGVHFKLNGTTLICVQGGDAQSVYETNLTATTIYQLATNDYVEIQVYQNSGGALNLEYYANTSPEFMMARVG